MSAGRPEFFYSCVRRTVEEDLPREIEYLLYDRNYSYLDNGGGPGYGGMMTKIVVRPAGTLGPQTAANA